MSPPTKHRNAPLTAQAAMETPVGLAFLFFSAKGLERLAFGGEKGFEEGIGVEATPETQSLPEGVQKTWHDQVAQALEDFFAGKPVAANDLPLDLQGTPFQLRVWQELQKILRGETVSYQELAQRVGRPKAARAVGQACGANPIPLLIPCHRVIASDGSLGGYSSGLERKRWLLKHEGAKGKESKGRKGRG
jgi:methylated-DNA-[protein]-cysteine S-methyltransferase